MVLLWIACATEACGGGDGGSGSTQPPTSPPKVATISLSRDTATLVPTAVVQLTATPKDGSGNSLNRPISWTSSDESKARVSSGGDVTGVAAGAVTISASSDGITAQARVTVKEGAVVGTSGGSVSALAGSVGLDIPAGAFAQATMLTVERTGSLPVDPRLVGETAVLLDAGTATVSQPLQLRLKYASDKVPSGPPERLLRLHGLRNMQWTLVASGVDGTAKVVSGAIQQLGTYAVLTPAFVAGVVISPSATDLRVGDTLTLNARAVDQSQNTLADREIVWQSTDASVVTVNSQTGFVTAVGAGSASVSATIEGKSAAVQFRAIEPVKNITLQVPQPLAVWSSVQLVAVTKDRNGNTLNGRPVAWISSDTLVARVSSAGVAEGMGPGTAVISATSEGVVGSASIAVPVQPPVTISTINPSPLSRGISATVTGSNFARRVSDNQVSVAGISAQVLSSTATQLQFRVPSSGLPCQTTAPSTVAVARLGSTAVSASVPLTVQSTRTLSLGAEPLYLDASNAACISVAVTAGQEYLIAASNAQTSATSLAGFDLIATNTVPAADVSRIQIEPLRDASQAPRAVSTRSLQQVPLGAPVDPHLSLVERNRAEFARHGSPVAAMAAARRSRLSADRASRNISTTLGALSAVRVPDLSATDFCNSYATIQARTVYVGQKSIVVEDLASPLAGQIDSYLTQIGQQFDTQQYPVLTNYFGNPLALDSQLDNNGRLVMVFSPKINLVSGVLGFVVSCDLYPQTMLSSSNEGELFYARIPTTLTGNTTAAAPGWFWSIRSTVIHESKHLASYAERISRGGLT
ncbi:MAG: Ig-like domain-containing protein, partial [Acidobacteria bacterium]|nr:Ig-like domain-containing protein [Acidobacteriota bacterium]